MPARPSGRIKRHRRVIRRTRRAVDQQHWIEADRLCGVEITCQQACTKILTKNWTSPIEDRVDQRDADGAAEIAHQIEQSAGVGDLGLRPRSSARRVAGNRHSMMLTPRKTCGQNSRRNRSSKSRSHSSEDRRQHAEANGGQKARVDPRFQPCSDGSGQQLHRARHHHDLADGKRCMTGARSQETPTADKSRHNAEPEHKTQSAAEREREIAKPAQIDERIGGPETPIDAEHRRSRHTISSTRRTRHASCALALPSTAIQRLPRNTAASTCRRSRSSRNSLRSPLARPIHPATSSVDQTRARC